MKKFSMFYTSEIEYEYLEYEVFKQQIFGI
jgi:hypothetical protein